MGDFYHFHPLWSYDITTAKIKHDKAVYISYRYNVQTTCIDDDDDDHDHDVDDDGDDDGNSYGNGNNDTDNDHDNDNDSFSKKRQTTMFTATVWKMHGIYIHA